MNNTILNICFVVIFSWVAATGYAQEDNRDKINIGTDSVRIGDNNALGVDAGSIGSDVDHRNSTATEGTGTSWSPTINGSHSGDIGLEDVNPQAVTVKLPVLRAPYLAKWDNGILLGSHGSMGAMGMYDANMASIYGVHQIGKLSLSGMLELSKIHSFHNTTNGAQLNLSASYPLSRNISVTGFGGAYQTGFLQSNSAMGYYYGGYMTFMTNNRKWGADVGVRRVYNPYTGAWENIPIAMPYYNLNGAKLGIDVGGLLYGILQGAKESKISSSAEGGKRGPNVIMPPKNEIQMRPLEVPNRYK